jgi:redox-sensitive bicupin YhaK (pirin superfamily)
MQRSVEFTLPASVSQLPGDFVVHRALPRRELRRVGGFVFFDHFNEADITADTFDVPPHPHIGLQTVTYLFDGEILHTDSLDNRQMITPGEVNWMTAGRGITHSEQVVTQQKRLHGIQTWVGLPHNDRKIDPDFVHFPSDEIPEYVADGFRINIIAGECLGKVSPIPTFQKLTYLDATAAAESFIELPTDPSHELAVYVCLGSVEIGGQTVKRHDLAKLTFGEELAITALEDSRFVIVGGEPLPEPTVIYWNFIADTLGEAKQAMIDWEDGKFPPVRLYKKVSDDDVEPGPDIMKYL